jgi:hypothetical protein
MAKPFILGFVLLVLGLPPVSAQDQVMSSAGHHGRSSEVALTWSVGEVVIANWRGQNCMLTNGFHQGAMEHAIRDVPVAGISMYPNPAREMVRLSIAGDENEEYTAVLYNSQGARLREAPLLIGLNLLSIADIRPGLIICRVYKSGEELLETQKIIKY